MQNSIPKLKTQNQIWYILFYPKNWRSTEISTSWIFAHNQTPAASAFNLQNPSASKDVPEKRADFISEKKTEQYALGILGPRTYAARWCGKQSSPEQN